MSPLRFGVSTKIFLGFAVVIASFAIASLYSAYRMQNLGESVRFIRRGALPAQGELRVLRNELKAFERALLDRRRQSDLEWARSNLPELKPYERLGELRGRVEELAARPHLNATGRRALEKLGAELLGLESERGALAGLLDTGSLPAVQTLLQETGELSNDHELYELLTRAFTQRVDSGELEEALEFQTALRNVLRQLDRRLSELGRQLDEALAKTNEQAERDEENAVLAVVVLTAVALLISLSALLISHFTLAPIRQLREGVQRIAEGDYGRRVNVATQDEIGQLAGEFNRMVESLAERDRQLARQREALLRTERLATIGKMSAHITHEIRNPLLPLSLNVELLKDELDSALAGDRAARDEVSFLVDAMSRELDRLKAVTGRYLDFARLPTLEPGPTDLVAAVRDTLQFHRSEFTKFNVVLEAELEPVPELELDGQQIRQILVNLLRNAAEALPEGGKIWVKTGNSDGVAFVEVADDGPGISEEDMEKVFGPFFSTKRTGTGLGLAVTQQIMALHGGSIEISCPEGGGTRVALRFPVMDSGGRSR